MPGVKGPTRGFKGGYTRREVVEFIARIGEEKTGKIKFDTKEITEGHRARLIAISKLWAEVESLEKKLEPGAARRDRKLAVIV